jgi:hypothetical protein
MKRMEPTRIQFLAPIVFIAIGLLLTLASWGVLSHIFEDHPDNSTTNYFLAGLPWLAGGLIFLAIGGAGLYSAWRASRSSLS